jgi:hypothetical protein
MLKKIYRVFHAHYHKYYHGIYANAKKLFAFDLGLLALSVIILAAGLFFFFWKPGITDLVDLKLSFGDSRISSGETVKLTIDYANRSKYKLTNISLGLRLPDGFEIDRSRSPENIFSKNSIFIDLKELPAGAKGQLELYGRLWTTFGKEEKIVADISYQPEKTNRREQKLSTLIVNLPAGILEGKLEMSSSSFPGYALPFRYELTNRGDAAVDNISLTSNWPDKFLSEKDSQNISLPPKGVKVISGTLKLPGQSGIYNMDIVPLVTVNGKVIAQQPSKQTITTVSPQVTVSAQITDNTAFAQSGQTIPVRIKWENKSAMPLQNMRLRLNANYSGIVNWAKTASENHAKYDKEGLVIDGSSRTALSSGAPGSQDDFTVNIILLSSFTTGQIEKAYLEIIPVFEAYVSGVSGQQFSQEGARARLPLATEARLTAEARYYTEAGDQLGRGPLPPKAGKTTKYWIFIRLSNTSNALDDAAFSAVLPAGVDLTGKESVSIGPKLAFNASTRALSWNYISLPANSQTALYFEVSVTPSESQIGSNILLLKNAKFTATDSFVSKTFNLSAPTVYNILNKNDRGSQYGPAVTP